MLLLLGNHYHPHTLTSLTTHKSHPPLPHTYAAAFKPVCNNNNNNHHQNFHSRNHCCSVAMVLFLSSHASCPVLLFPTTTSSSFQCVHTFACMPNVFSVHLQVPQGKWKLNRNRNTTKSISSSTIITTTAAGYKNEVLFFWKCKHFCYRESESCAKPYVLYIFFFGRGFFPKWLQSQRNDVFVLRKKLVHFFMVVVDHVFTTFFDDDNDSLFLCLVKSIIANLLTYPIHLVCLFVVTMYHFVLCQVKLESQVRN